MPLFKKLPLATPPKQTNHLPVSKANEPSVRLDTYQVPQGKQLVLVAKAGLTALKIAGKLVKKNKEQITPQLILIRARNQNASARLWQALKKFFSKKNSILGHPQVDSFVEENSELFTPRNLNNLQADLFERQIEEHKEVSKKTIKILIKNYGDAFIRKLISQAIYIEQEWTDENTFASIKAHIENINNNHIVVYASNIVSLSRENDAMQILENIYSLKPRLAIHSSLNMTNKLTDRVFCYTDRENSPDIVFRKISEAISFGVNTDNKYWLMLNAIDKMRAENNYEFQVIYSPFLLECILKMAGINNHFPQYFFEQGKYLSHVIFHIPTSREMAEKCIRALNQKFPGIKAGFNYVNQQQSRPNSIMITMDPQYITENILPQIPEFLANRPALKYYFENFEVRNKNTHYNIIEIFEKFGLSVHSPIFIETLFSVVRKNLAEKNIIDDLTVTNCTFKLDKNAFTKTHQPLTSVASRAQQIAHYLNSIEGENNLTTQLSLTTLPSSAQHIVDYFNSIDRNSATLSKAQEPIVPGEAVPLEITVLNSTLSDKNFLNAITEIIDSCPAETLKRYQQIATAHFDFDDELASEINEEKDDAVSKNIGSAVAPLYSIVELEIDEDQEIKIESKDNARDALLHDYNSDEKEEVMTESSHNASDALLWHDYSDENEEVMIESSHNASDALLWHDYSHEDEEVMIENSDMSTRPSPLMLKPEVSNTQSLQVLSHQIAYIESNESVIAIDRLHVHKVPQGEQLVLIAKASLTAVAFACELAENNQTESPQLILIDDSRNSSQLWQALKVLFSRNYTAAELQQQIEHFVLHYSILFTPPTLDSIEADVFARETMQYIASVIKQYGYEFIQRVILQAVYFEQEWKDEKTFANIRAIIEKNAYKHIFVYAGTLLSVSREDVAMQILENIDSLNELKFKLTTMHSNFHIPYMVPNCVSFYKNQENAPTSVAKKIGEAISFDPFPTHLKYQLMMSAIEKIYSENNYGFPFHYAPFLLQCILKMAGINLDFSEYIFYSANYFFEIIFHIPASREVAVKIINDLNQKFPELEAGFPNLNQAESISNVPKIAMNADYITNNIIPRIPEFLTNHPALRYYFDNFKIGSKKSYNDIVALSSHAIINILTNSDAPTPSNDLPDNISGSNNTVKSPALKSHIHIYKGNDDMIQEEFQSSRQRRL